MRLKSERAADYAVLQAMLTDERLSRGLRLDLVELTALAEAVGFDLLEFVTRFRERTRSR
jgi:hypothetical protein